MSHAPVEFNKAADVHLAFWENLNLISRHQASIAANYRSMFAGAEVFQKAMMQFAPANLFQAINPWSFSLMNFTRQIKGSAGVEEKIITEVAGYGSQLGTIIDFLRLMDEKQQFSARLDEHEAIYKAMRLKYLADDIGKAKTAAW